MKSHGRLWTEGVSLDLHTRTADGRSCVRLSNEASTATAVSSQAKSDTERPEAWGGNFKVKVHVGAKDELDGNFIKNDF